MRPPPTLPDAASVLRMGLKLSEQELAVIRMAMAIYTTSKQPKLTWTGSRHIAVALAVGSDHAQKEPGGRLDTPDTAASWGNSCAAPDSSSSTKTTAPPPCGCCRVGMRSMRGAQACRTIGKRRSTIRGRRGLPFSNTTAS